MLNVALYTMDFKNNIKYNWRGGYGVYSDWDSLLP